MADNDAKVTAADIRRALELAYTAPEWYIGFEVGLFLAEAASFEALGHTEDVSPYLICNQCADDVIKELEVPNE